MKIVDSGTRQDWVDEFSDEHKQVAKYLIDFLSIETRDTLSKGATDFLKSIQDDEWKKDSVRIYPVFDLSDIQKSKSGIGGTGEAGEIEGPTPFISYDPAWVMSPESGSELAIYSMIRNWSRGYDASSKRQSLGKREGVPPQLKIIVIVCDFSATGSQLSKLIDNFFRNKIVKKRFQEKKLKIKVYIHAISEMAFISLRNKYKFKLNKILRDRYGIDSAADEGAVGVKRGADDSLGIEFYFRRMVSSYNSSWFNREIQAKFRKVLENPFPESKDVKQIKKRDMLGWKKSGVFYLSTFSVPNNLPLVYRHPSLPSAKHIASARSAEALISRLKDCEGEVFYNRPFFAGMYADKHARKILNTSGLSNTLYLLALLRYWRSFTYLWGVTGFGFPYLARQLGNLQECGVLAVKNGRFTLNAQGKIFFHRVCFLLEGIPNQDHVSEQVCEYVERVLNWHPTSSGLEW